PAAELKDAYKRMAFGLADEVSGHCGPWVLLEDVNGLRKHYPEVARILHAATFAGWGVADERVSRVGHEETRRVPAARTKGIGLAITFLVIALVAFAAALYMASQSRLSGKVREPTPNPTPEEAHALLERGDSAEFDGYISTNLP